jgi:hypothetical protein
MMSDVLPLLLKLQALGAPRLFGTWVGAQATPSIEGVWAAVPRADWLLDLLVRINFDRAAVAHICARLLEDTHAALWPQDEFLVRHVARGAAMWRTAGDMSVDFRALAKRCEARSNSILAVHPHLVHPHPLFAVGLHAARAAGDLAHLIVQLEAPSSPRHGATAVGTFARACARARLDQGFYRQQRDYADLVRSSVAVADVVTAWGKATE